jgi:phosphohistidine swiveling domain-containing protein
MDDQVLKHTSGPEEAEATYRLVCGEFPDAFGQLIGAIEAVFKSWNNPRAKVYRKLNNIPAEWGTAVVVQAMVFGNMDDQSATGVLFTRNPSTGDPVVTGEYLVCAQGEDVVAGIRTPMPLDLMPVWNPSVYSELLSTVKTMETLKGDMQDVEFTIQQGVLYLLQTRVGKRSATASMKITLDLHKEGVISAKVAISRVSPRQFDLAQQAVIDPLFKVDPLLNGIPASPGVVSGRPVFDPEAAINCKEPFILVLDETTPEHIQAMHLAQGVITMTGGSTSHAAVVARGMNRACIVGVGADLQVLKNLGVAVMSMDGATGRIWFEGVPVLENHGNGLVHDFTALVTSTSDAYLVITRRPAHKMPCALLKLGALILNRNEAVDLILDCSIMVDVLYVDVTVDPAENMFISMFDDGTAVKEVLTTLESKKPEASIVLVGGSSKVYPTVGLLSDVDSLVLAEHEVCLRGQPVSGVSDDAVDKIVAWKIQEGMKFISLGAVQQGCKSFASVGVLAWG